MPAPLAVDKEAVRVLFVSVDGNAREAARQMGLSENTVLSWARRGNWTAQVEAAKEKANASLALRQPKAVQSNALKPADALANTLAEGVKRTRLGFTKYVTRMAETAGEEGTLEEAPLLKAVADIHAKMHPEQEGGDRVTLQFFAISGHQEDTEKPVVDI